MNRYVGLLYSIVLAPGVRVKNAPLRSLLRAQGLENLRALLSTGNVIFDSDEADPRVIEGNVERAFAEQFGRAIDFIVRADSQWQQLVAANPFPHGDPSRVGVRVMRHPITAQASALLSARQSADDRVQIVNGDPWTHLAQGVTTSRLASVMTPRRIGVGTMRNYNTVVRIAKAL